MGHRHASVLNIFCGLVAALVCVAAAAQSFPSHPLTFIFTSDPSTPVFPMHRAMMNEWSQRLGQTIIFDQRSGASQRLGVLALEKARGDGHVITAIHSGIVVSLVLTEPDTFDKLPDRDYTPISFTFYSPSVMV